MGRRHRSALRADRRTPGRHGAAGRGARHHRGRDLPRAEGAGSWSRPGSFPQHAFSTAPARNRQKNSSVHSRACEASSVSAMPRRPSEVGLQSRAPPDGSSRSLLVRTWSRRARALNPGFPARVRKRCRAFSLTPSSRPFASARSATREDPHFLLQEIFEDMKKTFEEMKHRMRSGGQQPLMIAALGRAAAFFCNVKHVLEFEPRWRVDNFLGQMNYSDNEISINVFWPVLKSALSACCSRASASVATARSRGLPLLHKRIVESGTLAEPRRSRPAVRPAIDHPLDAGVGPSGEASLAQLRLCAHFLCCCGPAILQPTGGEHDLRATLLYAPPASSARGTPDGSAPSRRGARGDRDLVLRHLLCRERDDCCPRPRSKTHMLGLQTVGIATLPSAGAAMRPFDLRVSTLIEKATKAEIAALRAGNNFDLKTTASTPEDAVGACCAYLSGTANWYRWRTTKDLLQTREFKELRGDGLPHQGRQATARRHLGRKSVVRSASDVPAPGVGRLAAPGSSTMRPAGRVADYRRRPMRGVLVAGRRPSAMRSPPAAEPHYVWREGWALLS